MKDRWVIDVTYWPDYCFCPLNDDGVVLDGMNIISDRAPGELCGVLHQGGPEVVFEFIESHRAEIDAIYEKSRSSHE